MPPDECPQLSESSDVLGVCLIKKSVFKFSFLKPPVGKRCTIEPLQRVDSQSTVREPSGCIRRESHSESCTRRVACDKRSNGE